MNKFFSKTINKSRLWAVIMAIVVAVAIVVCAVFGFNEDATLKDSNNLTVSVNKYAYNTQKELILQECESKFGGEKANYVVDGEMGGDNCEIIFVFDKDVDVSTIKTAVAARFAEITKEDSGNALAGAAISVSAAKEVVVSAVANGFVVRAVIAIVIFAVLAFGYIAIRNKNAIEGLWGGGSILVSMLMAMSLIILCRVPVTTTLTAIIAAAGLLTAAISVIILNKTKTAKEENSTQTLEERIISAIPVKESAYIFIGLTIAVILVGVLGGTFGIWFALASVLALLAAAFISLVVAPASLFSLESVMESKPAKDVYVGARKTSKREKKVYEKKSVQATVAEPAEEVTEPAEEVAEPAEEVAEPAEEVAEPAEEVAEPATEVEE